MLKAEIKGLKQSISFRVGQQIVKDFRRPLHWPLLPIKLFRIYKQRSKSRPSAIKLQDKTSSVESITKSSHKEEAVSIKPKKQNHLNLDSVIDQFKPKKINHIEMINGRICYVLHNSLPYASGGYATRAHGFSKGLRQNGHDVVALTRPGFPIDTMDIDAENVSDHNIDGVDYIRDMSVFRKGLSAKSYMEGSIASFEAQLKKIRPSIVIAASFPLSAAPAIIAAKRLGIPTIYELRGLEEITKQSRDKAYVNTPEFFSKVKLETATAKAADHVFTLTDAMREELIQRGVDQNNITLIPNSCDVDSFTPMKRNEQLAKKYKVPENVPVIGYIGSIVFYEGLDDLIKACSILKKDGHKFRLLIVGSEHSSKSEIGPITQEILNVAKQNNLEDWLIMPGRISNRDVQDHYSLIDIAPFPRKSLPVCEMVSPMKPLEAMAMEKAIVVSSVRALTEMVKDNETGLIFEKGNIMSLANVLRKLIKDHDLRAGLGKKARAFVSNERKWVATAAIATGKIKLLTEQAFPDKKLPAWWSLIDPKFSKNCDYLEIANWELSEAAQEIKNIYINRFDEESINRRIPLSNWKRADICWQTVPKDLSIIDIGSGLGEFINLFAVQNKGIPITSVDTRDWDKYFDYTGRIERIYKNIFELGDEEARDVVTCFEVIEHLPPERVAEAVNILRSLARKNSSYPCHFLNPSLVQRALYKVHRK